MSGGFNNVYAREEVECANLEEATNLAYEYALEEFDSYAGLHGVKDFDECLEEADGDELLAEDIYREVFETWVVYYAEEVE